MTKTKDTVDLSVPGTDAPMRCHLAQPATGGRHAAVIVAHELFGVTDDITGVLDRLADLGYVAAAPELYHRTAAPGAAFPRDDDGRAIGFEHLDHVTRASAAADIGAVRTFLRARDDADGGVAMLGFSFGGHVAYYAATQLPLDLTVVLYGGWLTDTGIALSRPEPTVTLTPGIAEHDGRVAFLVGADDHLISAAQRHEIDAALSAAGVPHEVVAYPGAGHAFFWPGSPSFDADARDAAWQRIETLLAETFTDRATP